MTAIRLKQAALTLFAESGYDGVSLSEIAKSVGIKTPSIYAHFESKEQLFLELVADAVQEEHEKFMLLFKQMADRPPIERYYAIFRFYTDLDELSKGQSFLRRTMLMPPRNVEERLRRTFAVYEDGVTAPMTGLLRECAGPGSFDDAQVERLLALFYAAIDGLLVEHKLYDTEHYRRRQALIWEWLQDSLRLERAR